MEGPSVEAAARLAGVAVLGATDDGTVRLRMGGNNCVTVVVTSGWPLLVLEPSWVASAFNGSKRIDADADSDSSAFTRQIRSLETVVAAGRKNFLSESGEGGGSSLSSLVSSTGSLACSGSELGLSCELSAAAIDATVAAAVAEANGVLGDEAFSVLPDLGLVRFTFCLANFGTADDDGAVLQLSRALDLPLTTRVCVNFNFNVSGSVPLVTASLLKEKLTGRDAQIQEFFAGLVRHVQGLFNSNPAKLRHYGQSTLQAAQGSAAAPLRVREFVSKRKKPDERVDEQSVYRSSGGLLWRSMATAAPASAVMTELLAMGFSFFDVAAVMDKAAPKASMEELVGAVLAATDKAAASRPSSAETALDALSRRYSRAAAAKALASHRFHEERARDELGAMVESLQITSSAIVRNVFLAVVEFVCERCRHYTRYCISCHEPHNCDAATAVVCARALCVFRFETFRIQDLVESSLCVFEECGCTNWAKKCCSYFGESLEAVSKKYGILPQTVLEMAFHRYLPRDEMLKFFAVIKFVPLVLFLSVF